MSCAQLVSSSLHENFNRIDVDHKIAFQRMLVTAPTHVT